MSPDKHDKNKVEHYVNPKGFNPREVEVLTKEQERYYQAPQWKIIWWKFRKHKLAVVSAIILFFFYLCVPFAEIIAPYPVAKRNVDFLFAPPQAIHLFHDGRFVGPYVYGLSSSVDLENLKWSYETDTTQIHKLRFFCKGEPYKFWGLFSASLHVVCPAKEGTLFIAGTDRLGRDQYSGLVYGARLSLTIGLIGVSISMVLGVLLGGLAGFFGGWVDNSIQRVIEIMRSLPELPLWMALSAALPVTWSPVWIYFGLTVILGLLDWPGLARAVRSKLLSLREEEYAKAAALMGASPSRIIFKHLLPGFTSHLVASATLSVPAMILGETALSFLNLGLRRPAVSWGVLLNEAQNISVVTIYPWLMAPVIPIIIVVLAFNFLGDGLRDAADPYK
ncbi:Oligopeptide transport system permease protein OppC [Pseudovibrio axinellae]|uniref:Oligopeptide transport system permease protein OppC n=1 Tax=Pseudovibrio axinellae TaxID=989403 RepID=A0A161XGN7_9HYPH|nr:ABC transporter permease [Pseudovibrio axinellae]KZL21008.1 Oligopeptide transport system permease protein OppC [Pseudovibrio axinellae]SEP79210.1 peptide/nickel transport system permease protein [Pseudovibrio axinellae]